MSYDPFQAVYSGTGGVLLLHLTTIESTYPTVCVSPCVCVTQDGWVLGGVFHFLQVSFRRAK